MSKELHDKAMQSFEGLMGAFPAHHVNRNDQTDTKTKVRFQHRRPFEMETHIKKAGWRRLEGPVDSRTINYLHKKHPNTMMKLVIHPNSIGLGHTNMHVETKKRPVTSEVHYVTQDELKIIGETGLDINGKPLEGKGVIEQAALARQFPLLHSLVTSAVNRCDFLTKKASAEKAKAANHTNSHARDADDRKLQTAPNIRTGILTARKLAVQHHTQASEFYVRAAKACLRGETKSADELEQRGDHHSDMGSAYQSAVERFYSRRRSLGIMGLFKKKVEPSHKFKDFHSLHLHHDVEAIRHEIHADKHLESGDAKRADHHMTLSHHHNKASTAYLKAHKAKQDGHHAIAATHQAEAQRHVLRTNVERMVHAAGVHPVSHLHRDLLNMGMQHQFSNPDYVHSDRFTHHYEGRMNHRDHLHKHMLNRGYNHRNETPVGYEKWDIYSKPNDQVVVHPTPNGRLMVYHNSHNLSMAGLDIHAVLASAPEDMEKRQHLTVAAKGEEKPVWHPAGEQWWHRQTTSEKSLYVSMAIKAHCGFTRSVLESDPNFILANYHAIKISVLSNSPAHAVEKAEHLRHRAYYMSRSVALPMLSTASDSRDIGLSHHHAPFHRIGLKHQWSKRSSEDPNVHVHSYRGEEHHRTHIQEHLSKEGYERSEMKNHGEHWETYKKPGHRVIVATHPKGGIGVQHKTL